MMKLLYSIMVIMLLLPLSGCSTSGSSTYEEAELPAAVPSQFQGWWKGKSEWDYLSIAPDGLMRTVMPEDLQARFDPALTKPNANSYLKVLRNQGDTLYGISKEQRFDSSAGTWKDPVYYYVTLHYDFRRHILTYLQEPCRLGEDDLARPVEEHLARMTQRACTTIEDSPGQNIWKRTTTYYRYSAL